MSALLHVVGTVFLAVAETVGALTVLVFQLAWGTLRLQMDPMEAWRNLYKVGVKSFPIVVVTAILVGAIMVIQTGQLVAEFDAFGLLGWGAGFATLREVGPVMIGLMFSGRVGANNTAELGTMKVTEQVDALRALSIDPLPYLLVPRFVAIVSMMVLLTIVGDLTALAGGALTAKVLLGVEPALFYHSIDEYLKLGDFLNGLAKALFFGVAIATVSCHYGMSTEGGAVGVGRSVNNSVVASAVSIFLFDYVITYVLK
ncbi:MAG: ABC transporter permease [Myxococcales bacterium]|nr:ABC transporter permease [Myxococcales bacterium]MCB9530494.1 ABC transporter permease [Myxococcales bacterium]MCB9533446.1 ABC transporter permease [Myxococcales bacterium]